MCSPLKDNKHNFFTKYVACISCLNSISNLRKTNNDIKNTSILSLHVSHWSFFSTPIDCMCSGNIKYPMRMLISLLMSALFNLFRPRTSLKSFILYNCFNIGCKGTKSAKIGLLKVKKWFYEGCRLYFGIWQP